MGDWVVVLEFSPLRGDRPFELSVVQALIERLREWHPSGLYNPDRYAVQLHIAAAGADEALRLAMAYYEHAAPTEAAAAFTRAEVLTLSEFEASWHPPTSPSSGVPAGRAAQALISVEVYEATRALLSATAAPAVTDILVRFVLAVGGQVSVDPPRAVGLPGVVSVDLSISAGEQLQALADNLSVAGLIIERWLPPLIDDAKRTLVLLERPHRWTKRDVWSGFSDLSRPIGGETSSPSKRGAAGRHLPNGGVDILAPETPVAAQGDDAGDPAVVGPSVDRLR